MAAWESAPLVGQAGGSASPAWQSAPLVQQQGSIGGDIAKSTGSRLAAGVLDIPGSLGDLRDLAANAGIAAGDLTVKGINWALGRPQLTAQEEAELNRKAAAGAAIPGIDALPTSAGIKQAVGFQDYQPQTDTGKVYDKYVGTGVEMAPSLLASSGSSLLKKAGQVGVGAALKQGGSDVAKFALAPGAASEVAGDITKGTDLEPIARTGAAILTGAKTGHMGGEKVPAPSIDELRTNAKAAYDNVTKSGLYVKPDVFDNAVDDITQTAKREALDLHPEARGILNTLEAEKGVPKSIDRLDALHQFAGRTAKSLDPSVARAGSIIANKIDDFMEGLKPADVANFGNGTPADAYADLIRGRDLWRRMRGGERIENMIQKARDRVGANYTAAGMQTALRQEFKNFKWRGKQISRDYMRLQPQEKAIVNSIVRGVSLENALRLVGKFNLHGIGALGSAGLGFALGGPMGAIGVPLVGEAARHLSAASTMKKVNRLSEAVRGGSTIKPRLGATPFPPMPIVYSLAAKRATDNTQ